MLCLTSCFFNFVYVSARLAFTCNCHLHPTCVKYLRLVSNITAGLPVQPVLHSRTRLFPISHKGLQQFQEHLSDYKIIVFDCLNPIALYLVEIPFRLRNYLLYDRDLEHYSVIIYLNGAMAQRYICNGCDTLYDYMHKTDNVCSLCTATPPCTKDEAKYCVTCNRRFLS